MASIVSQRRPARTSGMKTIDDQQKRKRVALAMLISVVLSVAAVGAGLALSTGNTLLFETKLVTAMQAGLIPVLWLAGCIANVARIRFCSAKDIDAAVSGEPSGRLIIPRAVLQNAHEQATLAVIVYLAAALSFADPRTLLLILVSLFSVGRALFWFGYSGGAVRRAVGFALTFYPSLLILLIVIAQTLRDMVLA